MEVVAASNFLSEFVNTIVKACIWLWLLLCVHESQYVKHAAGRLYGLQYEGK